MNITIWSDIGNTFVPTIVGTLPILDAEMGTGV